ncbi:MAG TPA: DUF1330 domain-containing protein [Candidatus Binatia bacterium]|jgi:uncharacterized protein (DUF1330 family)|nr:DUF1330 domain-containing protein [Candidatus Binatia bacterium]
MDEQIGAARAVELTQWYGAGAGPTITQWQRVLDGPGGAPVTVINFFKLRPMAAYATGGDPVSGFEAMMRYAAVSGPTLEKVGGRFLLSGPFETTLIGDDEDWDLVAIGAYPTRDALLALFDDAAYREAWAHRVAAVERQRVVIAAG